MASFVNLPVELLPVIVSNLSRPQHLAATCLVNKTFHQFAVPNLYDRVAIYAWQRKGKTRVIQVFTTLSKCSHLARLVHHLELRDFPKTFLSNAEFTLDVVLSGLQNCTNLRACTWTRDGSLNSSILRVLQIATCGALQELEINGRSDENYDPRVLMGFTSLTKLGLIMPSGPVVEQLKGWLEVTGGTLRNMTIICMASPIITDALLESFAPCLSNLNHLYITGCPRVTYRGIGAILSHNTAGIIGLGLEDVSPKFDMEEFNHRTLHSNTLASLTSITLTIDPSQPLQSFLSNVSSLLSSSPLQNFHIYSTLSSRPSDTSPPSLPSTTTDSFWSRFVETHGQRLVCVSVHGMLVGMRAIEDICKKCVRLEQFLVVVEPGSLETLSTYLALARSLRTVHINYLLTPHAGADAAVPVISVNEALSVIRRCSSSLTQFGCNARVWQVSRTIEVGQDGGGEYTVHPRLAPFESPDIPELFLVVRT